MTPELYAIYGAAGGLVVFLLGYFLGVLVASRAHAQKFRRLVWHMGELPTSPERAPTMPMSSRRLHELADESRRVRTPADK